MAGEKQTWLGPGETARRLGVSTKALKVYEREGLVVPHRAESGWRLYGPDQIARLHQIIVLRDLGLPLKSISGLIGSRSHLRDVLRLQRESLAAQHDKITRAIGLIEAAQRQLEDGRDLSLDDLATLTKETVVQQQNQDKKKFSDKFEALIADGDPTGEAGQAFRDLKAQSTELASARRADLQAVVAEATRLKEIGDTQSDDAKAMVHRWRSITGALRRPAQAQMDAMRDAYAKALTQAKANSEPIGYDPDTFEFIAKVIRGMKERGELA
ncbi:MAG TPA: MerR family transcriptional regulator [Caulobacteraceae bacterium]|jgi:DNA-binding transcriptional MerR regulator